MALCRFDQPLYSKMSERPFASLLATTETIQIVACEGRSEDGTPFAITGGMGFWRLSILMVSVAYASSVEARRETSRPSRKLAPASRANPVAKSIKKPMSPGGEWSLARQLQFARHLEAADVEVWTAILSHRETAPDVLTWIAPLLEVRTVYTGYRPGSSKAAFAEKQAQDKIDEQISAAAAQKEAEALRGALADGNDEALHRAAITLAKRLRVRDRDRLLLREQVLPKLRAHEKKTALEAHLAEAARKEAVARDLRNEVIARNQGLVHGIAHQFRPPPGETHDDLVSAGNRGLEESINRYDYDRNLRLSTSATWRIRAHIQRHVKAVTDKRHGRSVRARVSLTAPPNKKRWIDPTSQEEPLVQAMLEDEVRDRLYSVLSGLSDRERTVIELRFGLRSREPMTQKEVGLALGVSKQMAEKIEKRALTKLRLRRDMLLEPASAR
jgi:RNA polymerase sporulation-specific sigma factor